MHNNKIGTISNKKGGLELEKTDIKRFLNADGKIIQLPSKNRFRVATLSYLAEKFQKNRNYTEKEVNEICDQWHSFGDYFMLRRELVDNGLLCREPNGSCYWRTKKDQEDEDMSEIKNIESKLNTTFHPIDFEEWERKQYFYYFTKMMPTGYSISVEVDITNTYHMVKTQNKKFFPAYLYVASKLIHEQPEFRISDADGKLGYYEVLHPSYAYFHEDDKTMSNMWTEYNESFEVFYRNYMDDQDKYADNHEILGKPEMPPQNSYMIGMLPWIQFTSYSPVPYAPMNYFPILQAGKYFDKDGKKMMPFSFTVHHAVADGYHVGLFLEKFRNAMKNPAQWMK